MSPRKKRNRLIDSPPIITGFKPTGCEYRKEDSVEINFEEYEAFKLADYNRQSHLDASGKMGVSRPTFTRIYDSVRKKIAMAFVEGRPIVITGGYVDFDEEWFRCLVCNAVFPMKMKEEKKCVECGSQNLMSLNEAIKNWQFARGHRKRAMGMVEYCICPSCNTKVRHEYGKPCNTYICPNCGDKMVRE
ncbi:MAG: DUF134 domain-containing protein [Chlorobi bacterium]|nr:DUF134 domain-containing protein [Chlorobiota bacterium]